MFIKAPNAKAGTGYVGDVNTAFRNGRQDAFRDYVDNFNFALKADAANNLENQNQVQRAFDNYKKNLEFDKSTRTAMDDAITQSQKIADDAYNFVVDGHRLDKNYPQAQEIGFSKAAQEVNENVNKETELEARIAENQNRVNNAPVKGAYDNSTYRSGEAKNNYQLGLYGNYDKAVQDLNWLNKLPEEDKRKEFVDYYTKMVRNQNPNFTGTDEEIMSHLEASGKGADAYNSYWEQRLRKARDEVDKAQAAINSATTTRPSRSNNAKALQDKYVVGKSKDLSRDDLKNITGGTQLGFDEDGNTIVGLPDGSYVVKYKDGKTGMRVGATTRNGVLLSPRENAEYHNTKISENNNFSKPTSNK